MPHFTSGKVLVDDLNGDGKPDIVQMSGNGAAISTGCPDIVEPETRRAHIAAEGRGQGGSSGAMSSVR
jgi:hypothetical protein